MPAASSVPAGVTAQHAVFPAEQRNAVLVVALFALASILVCSGFFLYVLAKAFFGWRVQYNVNGSVHKELKFYRTQFGILFLSLVFSDLIQAIGFVMGLHWVGNGGLPTEGSVTTTCTAQALMIQWGDVASALLAVFIAIHTGLILVLKFRPPSAAIGSLLALLWIFVIGLGMYGPISVQEKSKGPFYSTAGNWCWISKEYDLFRIYVHYDILFAAAGLNLVTYLCIYAALKARKHQKSGSATPSRFARFSSKIAGRPVEADASFNSQSEDEVAKRMLVYPIAYILVILPLSTYRTAGAAGHDWGLTANAICGAIFVSSGWVNVLMFVWTRKLVVWPGQDRAIKAPVRHVQPYIDDSAQLRRFPLLSARSGSSTKDISSPKLVSHSSDFDLDTHSQTVSFVDDEPPSPYEVRAYGHEKFTGKATHTSVGIPAYEDSAVYRAREYEARRTSFASSREPRRAGRSGRRRTSSQLSLSHMPPNGSGTVQYY